MTRVLAVDLGATSVRVAQIALDRPEDEPLVLHRAANLPVRDRAGTLRWDWPALTGAIREGIAAARAHDPDDPIASLGVDAWGVDYGLVDRSGRLLSSPVSYRDERTAGWRTLCDRIGAPELFRRTGVEPAAINTFFQLAAHDPGELARAHRILMLPELVVHELTGAALAERTSAGTTGLVDAATGDWDAALLAEAGIPVVASMLPPIQEAGVPAGAVDGIPVTLVHGHDTASAVAALPASPTPRAFVSSGSWLVVGAETDAPVISDAAFAAGLTNEPGPRGRNLVARNVPGFVVVERLLAAWGSPRLGPLLAQAADRAPVGEPPALDALAGAPGPEELLRLLAGAAGRREPEHADLLRIALTSMARAAAGAVASLAAVLETGFDEIAVVGGGARTGLFLELLEREAGIPVVPGMVEAAAMGNAMTQARALGLAAPS